MGHLHERPHRQPNPLVQHHQLVGDRHVSYRLGGDDHGPRPKKGYPAVQCGGETQERASKEVYPFLAKHVF